MYAEASTTTGDWNVPATNLPRESSARTHMPGPRNFRSPALCRASISRSRCAGGPESTKLKNPCHQPWMVCWERALSRSCGTKRPRSMYTNNRAVNRARVSEWSGLVRRLRSFWMYAATER
ncbi:hypothetical protein D3C73_1113330 [compost metagenome]